MKYDIHGSKLVVTDAIRSYIEEKLSRLNKYFENASNVTEKFVCCYRISRFKISNSVSKK